MTSFRLGIQALVVATHQAGNEMIGMRLSVVGSTVVHSGAALEKGVGDT